MVEGRTPAPPAARLLGFKLHAIDPEQGTIRVEFEACAAAAILGGEAFAQTLELKTSFVRPAGPGPIYGAGRVVHRGRDVVFIEGSLTDGEGRLIATASATARVIPFADRSEVSRS